MIPDERAFVKGARSRNWSGGGIRFARPRLSGTERVYTDMIDFHHIEQQIEMQRRAADVRGVAVAVVQGQQIVYAQGLGPRALHQARGRAGMKSCFLCGSDLAPVIAEGDYWRLILNINQNLLGK